MRLLARARQTQRFGDPAPAGWRILVALALLGLLLHLALWSMVGRRQLAIPRVLVPLDPPADAPELRHELTPAPRHEPDHR